MFVYKYKFLLLMRMRYFSNVVLLELQYWLRGAASAIHHSMDYHRNDQRSQ